MIGVQVDAADWDGGLPVAQVSGARTVHADLDGRNPRGLQVDKLITDLDGRLIDALHRVRGRFLLVRPDRVLAAVWSAKDHDRVVTGVRRWFTSSHAAEQAGLPPEHAEALTVGAGTARAERTS